MSDHRNNCQYVTQIGVTIRYAQSDTTEQKAFALVSPEHWGRKDWREPISCAITDGDLRWLGGTLDDVLAAIEHYTATKAVWHEAKLMNGSPAYVVKAAGYRAGPAGP